MTKEQFSKIVKVIAKSFDVEVEELLSRNKKGRVAMARLVLYDSLKYMGLNLVETGRKLGRDHATVRHGRRTFNNMKDSYETFRIKADIIQSKIKQIANEE